MSYPVGAFFCVKVDGPAGFGIGVGQALAGQPSEYEHAGMIVRADGTTVEAEPGGARYGNVADYGRRPMLVCDGPILDLPPDQQPAARARVAAAAIGFLGRKYSFADYLAIAGVHLTADLPKPLRWLLAPATALLRRYVAWTGRLICSQLCDAAFEAAGIHLFTGKLPGDVMPSDLAAWAEDWRSRHAPAA